MTIQAWHMKYSRSLGWKKLMAVDLITKITEKARAGNKSVITADTLKDSKDLIVSLPVNYLRHRRFP